ncbi:hypothetical protein ACFFMN_23100 [Planobispora siamensis]|uniref:PD-(D/E)XK nuclease superfamily protein n=1 Tax=Planobispora siamensis TaxID=936338 RepID=A0A8J3SJ41_9ACTN|nr:hypothetical protein [Planobispora siamensis]GIH95456.1 hypothetical protein Psi01_60860 [Planobispora siamensis]
MSVPTHATIAAARRIIVAGLPIGPREDPCCCGHGRHHHGGRAFSGKCRTGCGCRAWRADGAYVLAQEAMTAYGSSVMDDIDRWHTATYPRPVPAAGGWGVGPSDVTTCRKRIWYRELHPQLARPVSTSAALLGDIIHEVAATARRALYPWQKVEMPVRVPGLDRPGRIDRYDPVLALVDDIKTKGPRGWERLSETGPDEGYWKQVAVYGYGLADAGHPVQVMRLTYINRATGDERTYERPYCDAFARSAVGSLIALNVALDLGLDLPRDGRGTTDPICTEFCEFYDDCWSVTAARAAGVSPEFLTTFGIDADPDLVAWAAEVARGWKDDENEAEREYKAAISMLKGALRGEKQGRFGDYRIVEKTRQVNDYKRYWQAVADLRDEYLSWDPSFRGDFADWVASLPMPKRTETWIEVKRVTDPTTMAQITA